MKNLCDTCKFAKWNLDSVDNAYCDQDCIYKVLGEGNYVKECSSYKSNNVIMCVINFIKNVFN
jgi:hypothetical protein